MCGSLLCEGKGNGLTGACVGGGEGMHSQL